MLRDIKKQIEKILDNNCGFNEAGIYLDKKAIADIEALFNSNLKEEREGIIKEVIENIDIWLEVHDKHDKSFQSKDLIKFLRKECNDITK